MHNESIFYTVGNQSVTKVTCSHSDIAHRKHISIINIGISALTLGSLHKLLTKKWLIAIIDKCYHTHPFHGL